MPQQQSPQPNLRTAAPTPADLRASLPIESVRIRASGSDEAAGLSGPRQSPLFGRQRPTASQVIFVIPVYSEVIILLASQLLIYLGNTKGVAQLLSGTNPSQNLTGEIIKPELRVVLF